MYRTSFSICFARLICLCSRYIAVNATKGEFSRLCLKASNKPQQGNVDFHETTLHVHTVIDFVGVLIDLRLRKGFEDADDIGSSFFSSSNER